MLLLRLCPLYLQKAPTDLALSACLVSCIRPKSVSDAHDWSAGEGKMFSPGNLRASFDNPEYEKLISYWVGEKYTLRYTGGMVPDVFQVCRTL